MAIIAVLTIIIWSIWMVCWRASLGETPIMPADDIAAEQTLQIILLFVVLFDEGILYLCRGIFCIASIQSSAILFIGCCFWAPCFP